MLECNQQFKALLNRLSGGQSVENEPFLGLFNQIEYQKFELEIAAAVKDNEKASFKTNLNGVQPNEYWEVDMTPIAFEASESTTMVICSFKKTDDRIHDLISELLERETKFRNFFDQAPVGMCVLKGTELTTEYANENMLNLWGKTRDEIINKPQEIVHAELADREDILTKVRSIFSTGQQLTLNELQFSTSAGDAYLTAIYQPLKDETGTVTSIFVIVNDITEQVNFRKELLKAKDILKLAMDASGMGSWNVDLNSKRCFLSERAQEIYTLDHNNLSISEAKSLVMERDMETVSQSIRKALHHQTSFNIEYEIRIDGTRHTKWLRSTGKAYYDPDGKPIYIAGAVLDITAVKQNELRKNDFISMVSHELRTPLTSLSAYIQLLQYKLKDGKDAYAVDTLNKVGIQLKRMSLMIDGFLNVSLLEAGKIYLNKVQFNLMELIEVIAEENRIILPSHFIQVVGECDVMVNADKEKIGNVLNNLIGNAAKYSKKESLIAIKCETNDNEVIVSIEDEGIGIKASDLDKLFDRFYRVDSPDTKTISGFGVGLYICAELINQHGGKIWVESELKQGSTFYFSLPL
ncbi:sensor histidine kinase [Pedobacter endophyticus]|uniref:histidine kinase n=1 Tax=Pedobacter endophyticus TaxID=2789740 RepID=A0A7S9L0H6_9SPHI|nr:HAMP domain-containing sensor histidine kinase [Pedobacter endophyticus]QPH40024.1 PAS domain S-box protein [Pedobacter endophyticus]